MKKKIGVLVIIGIVLSIIGIITMVVSGVFAYQDYKNYNKYSEGKIELKQDLDYSFSFDNGTINIYKSDLEYSYIDYKIIDLFKFEVSNKNVKLTSKIKLFTSFSNKNNIDLYLADNINDNNIFITLNAGEIKSEENIICNSMDLKLNAGKITTSISCENNLNIHLNAGEMNIAESKAKSINVKINAGKLNMKSDFESLNFKINAGEYNLTCSGAKEDYNINIEKNAGTSNASNGGTGSKKIDGKINAGRFNISYAN